MYVWDEHPRFFRVREGDDSDGPRAERRPVLTLSSTQLRRLGLAPTDPRAQTTGARAQRSGRAFEAEVEAANAWYERAGRAVVYRHFPSVEGWGRTLRVTGRGPADFSGVARLPSGASVAVAFDCKVVTGEASYAHAERDRHQVESLVRFRDAGGVAFLLLRCRALDRVWLLDDIDALNRGERVTIRGRVGCDGVAIGHVLPVLEPAPEIDVARGLRPRWDYVALLRRAAARNESG